LSKHSSVTKTPSPPILSARQPITIWETFCFSSGERRSACYKLQEEEVFDLVFELYDQALMLDADNYWLAADVALSYYIVRPNRPAAALQAWERALERARTEEERVEARLHLARTQINTGLFDAARDNMAQIKDPAHAEAKQRLMRRLESVCAEQAAQRSRGPDVPDQIAVTIKAGLIMAIMPGPATTAQ